MKLNCRPGDLARIVHPAGYGKLVLVRRLIASLDHKFPDGWKALDSVGLWEIEMLGSPIDAGRIKDGVSFRAPVKFGACQDRYLRPIRDNDGEDETLTWAGKPETVTA